MFAITGVTGHVGGAAARALLAANQPVRAVVRDPQLLGRATAGSEVPAAAAVEDVAGNDAAGFDEVAVADFSDRAALATALQGCAGAFVLLPTIPSGDDAAHRELAGTIAGAVADSAVPHVVALSSYGAELAEGNGPIRWLHHFENLLRDTGARVTVIRSPHFQEKVEEVLAPARDAGIYPVFGESADVPAPMVATRDIGAAVADALVNSSPSQQDINTSAHVEVNTSTLTVVNASAPGTIHTPPRMDGDSNVPGTVNTTLYEGAGTVTEVGGA
ncbi:MAG TPA: NmrA family NAD(P)-binding protein, partial [Actinoplanes sp.]|nr:NmrA family NAD(P)-binding protein [Actinoplanes sp.]